MVPRMNTTNDILDGLKKTGQVITDTGGALLEGGLSKLFGSTKDALSDLEEKYRQKAIARAQSVDPGTRSQLAQLFGGVPAPMVLLGGALLVLLLVKR